MCMFLDVTVVINVYYHAVYLSFCLSGVRNLCLRVMLVEVSASVNAGDSTSLHHLPHTVLKHVYNSMPGAMFTDCAHTQVTYHSKNPVLNEEIKIRLPLALTSKHYLLFEVCID